MKAIVLSFDKHHAYCELSYRMYMNLWPNCPLSFRIPWNKKKPSFFHGKKNVELIHCNSSIFDTMNALLKDIGDNEWVYWCIDDRFPIFINSVKMDDLYKKLNFFSDLDFVKPFAHPKAGSSMKNNIIDNFVYQNSKQEWGFYMHQFCKSKILKKVFTLKYLPRIDDYHIKFVQYSRIKTAHAIEKYKGAIINIETNDFIKFKEPCIDGQTTKAGFSFLEKLNIDHDLS